MALKIRLRQQGRTNRTMYRLVVTDVRAPRDGKYIEQLGWYNPVEAELSKKALVQTDRVLHWLDQGAQLSDNARAFLHHVSPEVVRAETEKRVTRLAKAAAKRKKSKEQGQKKA